MHRPSYALSTQALGCRLLGALTRLCREVHGGAGTEQAQEEAGCPGHSGHFLLVEEGRAARAPSEGDSSPETDPFSSAVHPSSRGVPVLTECDSATIWGCWVYMPRMERTGTQR